MAIDSKVVNVDFKGKKTNYFRSVQAEFNKISWTGKKELISFTKIVLSSIFIFSFVIYFADVSVRSVLNVINVISKLIFG